jgi:hypothetical protein
MYINKLALALWKDPERRLAEVAKLRAVVDLLLAEREALAYSGAGLRRAGFQDRKASR